MRCESDFFENSEKECNLEDTVNSRLVSHPKSALSLDGIPGDSLHIVARPLDSVVPDYAVTQPDAEDLVRGKGAPKEINHHRAIRRSPRGLVRSYGRGGGQQRTVGEWA
jgi:hypothetical protein